MTSDFARRRSLLTAALGFALVDTKGQPAPKEIQLVREWLDNWKGPRPHRHRHPYECRARTLTRKEDQPALAEDVGFSERTTTGRRRIYRVGTRQ